MYNFIINLNTLIASLFLCIWFVIYTSVLTTKSKKDLIQLILITTILIMKISYILNRMKIDSLVMNNYGLLYMFIVENIVILMIFYFLFNQKKIRTPKKIILILDYILCVFSFILSQNNIYLNLNNVMIIGLMAFNICYFHERCHKAVQAILAFYILNFIQWEKPGYIQNLIFLIIYFDIL